MTAVFEFQKVTKRYGKQAALDEVSFNGGHGEVIALLGENGAGKTTALKILLGLLRPTSGSARVMGLDSQDEGPEIRRRIGYMPDRPALHDWMTVSEIGWFAAGFYPLGYQQRYQQLVRRFELPGDKKIRALSKGMQSKVSLALAMAHEPELLVLDEPTSGLDPLVRREFLENMVDVAAGGQTVLLSSHQIAEVERIADKIAIFCRGKLVLFESLDVLKSQVQEVIITFNDIDNDLPKIPVGSKLLGAQRQDRQWQLLVRDVDASNRFALVEDWNCSDVEFRTPSLEQICLICMKGADKNPHDRVTGAITS